MEVPIEKMFLIGENAWGKTRNDEMEILFIVIDKRFKDLEREEKILAEYSDANNISFILTSLCRYEKRKKLTTEKEYFVENFGIKIYDSEKQPSINEGIAETEYASAMKGFKSFRRYISSPAILMEDLLRIYILKLGEPVNKHKSDFKSEVKIAKMISTDEEGIKLIDEFIQEKDNKIQKEICKKFEKHLQEIKQVRQDTKLENPPTMQIYEKLLEEKKQKGKLDLKKLTK